MTNAVPAPVSELVDVARHVTPGWLRRLASGVALNLSGPMRDKPGVDRVDEPGFERDDETGNPLESRNHWRPEPDLWSGIESVIDRSAAGLESDLEALLSQDVEAQRDNPLTVFRNATAPLTAHLVGLGYPARPRDRFDIERFPDDVYGFAPASWADIDPALVAPGMAWGAWKAMTIIERHRNDDDVTDR